MIISKHVIATMAREALSALFARFPPAFAPLFSFCLLLITSSQIWGYVPGSAVCDLKAFGSVWV